MLPNTFQVTSEWKYQELGSASAYEEFMSWNALQLTFVWLIYLVYNMASHMCIIFINFESITLIKFYNLLVYKIGQHTRRTNRKHQATVIKKLRLIGFFFLLYRILCTGKGDAFVKINQWVVGSNLVPLLLFISVVERGHKSIFVANVTYKF